MFTYANNWLFSTFPQSIARVIGRCKIYKKFKQIQKLMFDMDFVVVWRGWSMSSFNEATFWNTLSCRKLVPKCSWKKTPTSCLRAFLNYCNKLLLPEISETRKTIQYIYLPYPHLAESAPGLFNIEPKFWQIQCSWAPGIWEGFN